jgi:hypothetical protein
MQKISFRDDAFLPEDCHLYDLSIHCSLDGFSILIQHPGSGSVLLCEHYPFRMATSQMLLRKVRELITGNDLLKQTYRKTTILFGDRQFSLVPETLWSEKLTEFVFSTWKKQEIETEAIVVSLQQLGAFLVFRTGKELFETLNGVFPGAEITHEVYPLLHPLPTHPDSRVHFHLHSSWFYALSLKEGKLEYIHSFDYQNETDMLYFMLMVRKEYNPENHPVIISGWIDREDSRFDVIKKHIPEALFIDQYEGNGLKDASWVSRYFYSILKGTSCE